MKQITLSNKMDKLGINIFYIFLIFLVLCNIQACRENVKEVKSNSISNKTSRVECFPKDSIDSQNIVTENLNNLKLFNGIKFLKFGTKFQDVSECVKCKDISDKLKSCSLNDTLTYLNLEWSTNLLFYKDLLTRIEIKTTNPELHSVYDKLHFLFGKPNSRKMELIKHDQYKDIIKIKGEYEYCFEPITEELNYYVNFFSEDKYFKRKNGEDIPNYKEFKVFVKKNEQPQMRIEKVKCDFLSIANYVCEWNYDIILNLKTEVSNELYNYDSDNNAYNYPCFSNNIQSEIIMDSDIFHKNIVSKEINNYQNKINLRNDSINREKERREERKKEIEIIKQF
jgi:hypothetical protein